MRRRAIVSFAVLGAVVAAGAGCGGGDNKAASTRKQRSSRATSTIPADASLEQRIAIAERPRRGDFPAVRGRTLGDLAASVSASGQLGLASSTLVPRTERVAFGVLGPDKHFLYGPTALYVTSRSGAPAQGPFLAPADSTVARAPFLSKTSAADTADIKAIYETQVRFQRPGRYGVLAVTKVASGRLVGATGTLTVKRSSPIPDVGERPPRISTDTVASAGGDLTKIDTRVPPDDMHKVNFKGVIGRRPVALLFATPALCQSRTCGPVTDLTLQVKSQYGKRMTFIHEEIYVKNNPDNGLRPQLHAFHLETEPWLFTFDRHGRVAARLEGSFGISAIRRAVQAALKPGA